MSTHLIEGKYSFTDLVNIPRLTKLFNLFSSSTGFALGLVSYPEQKTIIRSGWCDICTKFHRSFFKSQVNCVQSNKNLTSKFNTKKAIKAGCNEYIAKPVDRKELTEIIRSFKL